MNTSCRRIFWLIAAGAVLLMFSGAGSNPTATAGATFSIDSSGSCEFGDPHFITWFPKEFECPVCKTKNIFMVWGSYGSYIYQDPSKYQLIFWPYTDTPTCYSCKKCRLSVFLDDFEKIPAEKIAELREMLKTTSLPAQKERSEKEGMENPPYLEIPVSARLSVAEKVYRTLGKTDDEFWNHFYRVLGFHYDAEGKKAAALEARRKSISITEKLLADKQNEGRRKDLLYILGAMRHFTSDDQGAMKAFEEADKLEFSDKDLKPEQNKNYNEYLSNRIKEYIEMLKKGEGPRQKSQIGN
jgi:hypothetical protein